MSVMTGLAVNTYSQRLQVERLKSGTQSMAAWLDATRSLAIQQSETCAISLSASNLTLQLAPYGNQAVACASNSPIFNLREASSSENIALCADNQPPEASAPPCDSSTGDIQILFTPKGTSPSNALLQTHLKGSTENRCVQIIAPLGLLRIGKVVDGFCNWNTAS